MSHESPFLPISAVAPTLTRHTSRREFLQTGGRLVAATALARAASMAGVCSAAQPTGAPATLWNRQKLTAFMRDLAGYVVAHHLRRDKSPMRGMVYEFYDPAAKLQGHGGGLDTMHDGAWFANACILAYRATGDVFYLTTLRDWIMPFYVNMLNHSDTLFPERDGAFSDSQMLPPERAAACKGFVPYWWDDGHGVNFDARARKMTTAELQNKWGFTNTLPDPNDRSGRVSGYSHGTSNHMALALFPMLANWWLLSRDPEVAEAIHNLHEQRIYQFKMDLPFLAIADAIAHGDDKKAFGMAGRHDMAPWPPESPLYKAMVGKIKMQLPPFMDDPAVRYYSSATAHRVGPGTAKRLAQMAYDCIVLADLWYGDKRRPRGLAIAADSRKKVWIEDGKLSSHAGDLPDVLVGSRMGPQTLWACATSLQLLRAYPDAWAGCWKNKYKPPLAGWSEPPLNDVTACLQAELDEGMRFWQEQMKTVGHLRPDWPIGGKKPEPTYWSDHTSETGGYAHLIAACAAYVMLLDGKNDWELAHTVRLSGS